MHHGPIPEGMVIDHINGYPWDNRIENLRLASRAQNNANAVLSTRNTSGFKGVSRKSGKQKWVASLQVDGSDVHIGCFDTAEEAAKAYAEAAKKHFGEFARPSTGLGPASGTPKTEQR